MPELKRDDEENKHEEKVSPLQSSQASTRGPGCKGSGVHAVTVNAKLKNPLSGYTKKELMADVDAFAKEKDLEDIIPLLRKGALVAQNPKAFEQVEELDDAEREWLRQETTHRWHQPKMLFFMTGKHM